VRVHPKHRTFCQFLSRKLAQCFQHREPRAPRDIFPLHQTLVEQQAQAVQNINTAKISGDGLGRFSREPADEDAQLVEQLLLWHPEQLVTPVDRFAQRLLSRRHIARSGTQDGQPLRQTLQQFGRGQHSCAGSR
jgi:hypothetical protein